MKSLIRSLVINTASLYAIDWFLPGISVSGGIKGLAITAAILLLTTALIKPLVNLVLLPLNLITLGAFNWLSSVAMIYLVSLISPYFYLQGFIWNQFRFNFFWSLILTSFLFHLSRSLFRWLLR